jgi:hypothetical protein
MVLRLFENLTLLTSTKSYIIASDQYSVAIIQSACVFVGEMFHHVEVRCQLVALKDAHEQQLRLSDYESTMWHVRAWGELGFPRSGGHGLLRVR